MGTQISASCPGFIDNSKQPPSMFNYAHRSG
jgi:hypothetical protein